MLLKCNGSMTRAVEARPATFLWGIVVIYEGRGAGERRA